MSDIGVAQEIIRQISSAVDRVLLRFAPVDSVSFFIDSEEGLEKLDAICMQLIAIGESLKNFDKVMGRAFLEGYSSIDWKSAKGMRDVITHHYFDLDAEAVYDVCQKDMPEMRSALSRISADLLTLKP